MSQKAIGSVTQVSPAALPQVSFGALPAPIIQSSPSTHDVVGCFIDDILKEDRLKDHRSVLQPVPQVPQQSTTPQTKTWVEWDDNSGCYRTFYHQPTFEDIRGFW